MLKKFFAELIGTFTLVFMGCMSAVLVFDLGGTFGFDEPTAFIYKCAATIGVALVFGLSIIACAYVIGDISGCHINPAVSLAMLISGKLSLKDFIVYVIGQVAGSFAACGVIYAVIANFNLVPLDTLSYGSNSAGGTVIGALIVEFILTFIFIMTILGVTSNVKNSSVAGLVIGLTLTFVHIVGIPLTGTSVNPARSLAPAIFAGGDALTDLWIFIVAPLAGAAVAAIVYKLFYGKKSANDD